MTSSARPTIKDVARRAGVSRSLVSLLLQGSPKVSDTSAKAIRDAMEELGYRPNAAARSLRRGRSDTIGVLVSDLHNPFYAEVIDGLESGFAANAQEARVLIGAGGRDPDREHMVAEAFTEFRVEGLVLITPLLSSRAIAAIASSVPTVVVGRPGPRPHECSTVYTDDLAGGMLVVRHLCDLGHRSIAHISAPSSPGARARQEGYRKAMAELGLEEQIRIVAASPDEEGGLHGATELLKQAVPPTAIYASNDLAALGAMSAAEAAGRRVPGDVSVVGYDDSALAHLEPISLTSVHQPRFEMGSIAAELLQERMRGAEPRSISLQPSFAARRTSGPVPPR